MPVADTSIDSWAATVLDPGRDLPPDSHDILLTFLACAQAINHIDHIYVCVEATALNGVPEFLLTYTDESEQPQFTGVLASWEPNERRLYVKDLVAPAAQPRAQDTVFRARYYLTLLRQCQHKWGSRPLKHGVTDLVAAI